MKNKTLCLVLSFLAAGLSLGAQQPSGSDEGIAALRALYRERVGRYAVVYSGKAQTVYPAGVKQHPYYGSDGYLLAALAYDGLVYDSVYLRLDVVQDELVMLVPGNNYGMVLHPDCVEWAEMDGCRVLHGGGRATSGGLAGYYVELCGGAYRVVEKMEGKIEKEIADMSVVYYFDKKSRFYIEHEGVYYPMKNKNAFFKLFPERKAELNEYARERGLNFKQNPRAFLLGMASFWAEGQE